MSAANFDLAAWLERQWQGRLCLLTERSYYIEAAREWADHPDFAPPRYGYADAVGAAVRQCIGKEL